MKKIIFYALMLVSISVVADRQVGEITGIIPYESGGKKLFFFQLKDNVSGDVIFQLGLRLTALK